MDLNTMYFNPCPTALINMSHSLLFSSYFSCTILFDAVDSEAEWKIVQIQIRRLHQKPADLDLHCFLSG